MGGIEFECEFEFEVDGGSRVAFGRALERRRGRRRPLVSCIGIWSVTLATRKGGLKAEEVDWGLSEGAGWGHPAFKSGDSGLLPGGGTRPSNLGTRGFCRVGAPGLQVWGLGASNLNLET
jgi:hypothetical protein